MSRGRSVSAFVCLILGCTAGFAQSPASFTTKTYAAGNTAHDIYTVDINNDEVPDLIEVSSGNVVSLQIAYSTGNFPTPKTLYTFPATDQGTVPMVYGDFNGDNNVDLVFAPAGSNQLAFFSGNGNGTFQTPKYETIALPGGQWFGGGAIVAADFNHDGHLDLVTEGNTNTGETLYLIPGDGKGNFGAPQAIYSFAANTGMGSLAIGDFDGDGNADLALGVNSQCTSGGCAQADVYVLYGNGASGFTTDHVYNTAQIAFATGDVNSDGRTDIFGIGGADSNQLVVLTSQAGRQFTSFTMTAGETLSGGAGTAAPVVLADLNGDGLMDLATMGSNAGGSVFAVFLANGSGGYQEQTVNLGSAQSLRNIVVGTYGQGTKPDLATVWSNTPSSATLTVAQNTTESGSWAAGCYYPYPTDSAMTCGTGDASQNDVHITASAGSWGQVRKLEAWVDGKKIGEQYHVWENHAWLDLTTTLAPGNHTLTIIGADVDNRLVQSVGNPLDVVACEAPSAPGVDICSPTNSSTAGENVTVVASATVSGTLAGIQFWVDGSQHVGEWKSSPLVSALTLSAGSHRIAVVATNTAGEKWESVSNVTVASNLGCNAPSSPGVNLCSPTTGEAEEDAGEVEILATAKVTGTLANMQLWIDGAKQTSESTSSTFHIANFYVGTGSHRIAVLAVNTAGQVWESSATVSSQ